MKNIIHGRCEYNGCKARAYANRLCYKHFTEQLNNETEKNPEPSENVSGGIKFARTAFQTSAVVCVVFLWIACCASAALFGVFCYRLVHTGAWKIIAIAAILIAASYAALRLFLLMFDKFNAAKYIFMAAVLILAFFIANNAENLYTSYIDGLERLAYAFAENMKGILF